MKTHPKVDSFLERQDHWREEMSLLRSIAIDCGLNEEFKWGKPCYSHDGGNIAITQPFKSQCAFMFFKGALLDDPENLLEPPGANSRIARRMMFSSTEDVSAAENQIRAFIEAAVKAEEDGLQVEVEPSNDVPPEELVEMFGEVDGLKEAFFGLTPGRQRAYLLHFTGAKQSKTRRSRVERATPAILAGKGIRD